MRDRVCAGGERDERVEIVETESDERDDIDGEREGERERFLET